MSDQTTPNIPLIVADDIGWFDVGAYHRGIMGGPTPNIEAMLGRMLQAGAKRQGN